MTTPQLHGHFWYDLNQGKSINASDGSTYHIQHVARNPQKFGFKDTDEMQQHAHYPVKDKSGEDIESGYYDIDHDLEHHVMSKGFARGYHYAPYGNMAGEIRVDVANDHHAKKALEHFLPIIKDAESKGHSYDVEVTAGHRGTGTANFHRFTAAKDIEAHIGKTAKTGLTSKEPQTFRGVGQVSEPLRKKIKDALRKQDPTAPNWKLEQGVGYSTGTWGDSVEPIRTFKDFFKAYLDEARGTGNAAATLRLATNKTNQRRLAQAGRGNAGAAVTGAVASRAGLKASALNLAQRQAGRGRIPPSVAQKIAKAALQGG